VLQVSVCLQKKKVFDWLPAMHALLKNLTVIDTIDDMLVAIFEHGKPFKYTTFQQDTIPILC
jgi:hypothetical protein